MIWQANCSNIEFVQFYIQFCIFSYVSNIKLVLHIQPTSWHYAHFYLIFNYSFSTLLFIQHLTILSTLSSSFDIQFFIQHSTSTQLSTIHSTLNSSFNIKFIIQHLILHSIQLSWTLTISGQWCIALLLTNMTVSSMVVMMVMEMATYEDVVSKLGFALYTPRSQFKY